MLSKKKGRRFKSSPFFINYDSIIYFQKKLPEKTSLPEK